MKKSVSFVLNAVLLSSVLAGVTSCANWFQGKVVMDPSTNPSGLEDLFAEKEEIKELSVPTGLAVSQGLYPGEIHLTWNSVKHATSYRIERTVVKNSNPSGVYDFPDDGDFVCIKEKCYENSYSDVILREPDDKNEQYSYHYFYRVIAENYLKNLASEATDFTESRNCEGWLLNVPKNVDAYKGKSTDIILISWSPVQKATKYYIYRGEKENGSGMEKIGETRGNELSFKNYVLTSEQGVNFYYRVTAVIENEENTILSAPSSMAVGYSLKEGAPNTSGNVQVTNGLASSKSHLTVRWEEVPATGANATITYSLYRTSSVDSVYTLIKNKLTETEYTDSSSLKPGIIYYYFVQAESYDSVTQETLRGAFTENFPDSFGFLLSAPESVEIEDVDDSTLNIIWEKAVGSDKVDYKYSIYASDVLDGVYEPVLTQIDGAETADGKLSAVVAKRSFYKVLTNNPAGIDTESSLSSAAAPTPAAPVNILATKTEKLSAEYAPNKNNVYPVKVTWQKPANEDPAGYIVYRSTKADSGFRRLTTVPVIETEFIDENETAKAGSIYFYKVVSVNILGQGKKGNDPVLDTQRNCMGYGAITREQWFREYNKTTKASQKKLTLMHKSSNTDKLGSEKIDGAISGTLSYKATIAGLGGEVTMHYENYADFYMNDDSSYGDYFNLTGNTDTTAQMSGNGNMHGTVICTGMYPGIAVYDRIEIKNNAAGGGTYGVTTKDLNGNTIFEHGEISWLVGEE